MTEQEFMEDIHAYAEKNKGGYVTYNDCIIIRCVQLAHQNNTEFIANNQNAIPKHFGMSSYLLLMIAVKLFSIRREKAELFRTPLVKRVKTSKVT